MVAPLLLWGGIALGALVLTRKGPASAQTSAPQKATSKPAPITSFTSQSSGGSSVPVPPSLEYSENSYVPNGKTSVGAQTGGTIAGPIGRIIGAIGDAIYGAGSHPDPKAVDTFNQVENFQSTIPQPDRSIHFAPVVPPPPVKIIPVQTGFSSHPSYSTSSSGTVTNNVNGVTVYNAPTSPSDTAHFSDAASSAISTDSSSSSEG